MRIAITGTHGVGKTTLAKALAQELGLPLIEEVARTVASNMGYKTTAEIASDTILRKDAFQWQVLGCQMGQEFIHRCTGFISDRSVLDVIAYMQLYELPGADELILCAIDYAARNYTWLLYIPLGENIIEDDGFRLLDRKSQVEVDQAIADMGSKLFNCYTVKTTTPEERAEEVLNLILRGEMGK